MPASARITRPPARAVIVAGKLRRVADDDALRSERLQDAGQMRRELFVAPGRVAAEPERAQLVGDQPARIVGERWPIQRQQRVEGRFREQHALAHGSRPLGLDARELRLHALANSVHAEGRDLGADAAVHEHRAVDLHQRWQRAQPAARLRFGPEGRPPRLLAAEARDRLGRGVAPVAEHAHDLVVAGDHDDLAARALGAGLQRPQ